MRVTMPDTVRVVVGWGVGCDVGDVGVASASAPPSATQP